jgi:NAD(P)-dependent dehydrogenase (short-subunit alcohol dehydrogenase family)
MRIPRPIGGKVVVITGAARGIGEALAVKLAGRGARVALVGLEPDRLAEVAQRCGPNAGWWECDVTDAESLARAAAGVKERFTRVDVLIANAGIATGATMLQSDPVSFDRVIEVNLLGSVRTVRAFLPLLVASRGYYLQIASLAALTPAPLMAAYSASKAGVEAFALSLRTEVAYRGVDVGVAYLSFTNTDMTRAAWQFLEAETRSRQLPGPLGRLWNLDEVVDRLAGAIERRSPFAYGQSWIRVVRPLRGLLPSLIFWAGRRRIPHAEADLARRGPESSLPVGAGGQADIAAREAAGSARRAATRAARDRRG